MSHFSFCTMSQCRPTFIVKHKTAHKYAAKEVLFRYTQRTVQYCKPCDSVVLTNHIYNFSLLFGGESVCSSSTVWFSFSPAKYKYFEHTVFYRYAVLQYTRQIDFVPVLHPEGSNDGSNCEAAEIWLDTLASLPHAQTMVSFEMTILLLSPPPPSSPSHPLPPPCPPPTPPPPCPHPSCPLPPPLTLTPLLLWLLISSKFSIVYQTKQRLKALLCCSPHCKLLNRPECLEI